MNNKTEMYIISLLKRRIEFNFTPLLYFAFTLA